MGNAMKQIQKLWSQLETGQRVIFFAVLSAVLLTLVIFFTWLGSEDYTQLYSNLSPEETSRVIEVLQSRSVDYRLTGGGSGVTVPGSRIAEMRVEMAKQGIPDSGVVGYEIFDEQGLGVSEFTQNLNYSRALEGELSRSITLLRGIDQARVHLVIPKPALFKEDRRDPSASVVLGLSRPKGVAGAQVMAIQQMISSAVEGLEDGNVTVLDGYGNLLSREEEDELTGLSNSQLALKQDVESYLSRKAENTLESVLGSGSAIVEVNADLDFEKVERTSEIVDPESATILSEVRTEEKSDETGQSTESSTVNYEFNRTVESVIGSVGGIRNLSVAILVDGKYAEDDDGQMAFSALGPRELEGYRKIVENIVGFSPDRGDRIEILSVPFQQAPLPVAETGILAWPIFQDIPGLIQKIIFMAGMLFLLLILRNIAGKLSSEEVSTRTAAPEPALQPAASTPQENPASWDELVSEKAQQDMMLEEQARALAMEKPEEIAQLVRTWIHTTK
jgi:flagellar M-ring protein FliF